MVSFQYPALMLLGSPGVLFGYFDKKSCQGIPFTYKKCFNYKSGFYIKNC